MKAPRSIGFANAHFEGEFSFFYQCGVQDNAGVAIDVHINGQEHIDRRRRRIVAWHFSHSKSATIDRRRGTFRKGFWRRCIVAVARKGLRLTKNETSLLSFFGSTSRKKSALQQQTNSSSTAQ
ncbi:hypothetical protein J6590_026889 [Homalodisca vitripennis]|nr:hypothetical protein J6590_026889 [Homalodisca vitripennis]